ncbi:MAG: hypothetical protein AB8I08_24265 [Sandaracinaceae bacterium]
MTKKPAPKWRTPVLVVIATAPIAIIFGIFLYGNRYQSAFDEQTCPFEELSVQDVQARIQVREERRICQPDVEEHRWVLLREGRGALELGRRPLGLDAWTDGYHWETRVVNDRVRVLIHNVGQDEPRIFQEPSPEAGLAEY